MADIALSNILALFTLDYRTANYARTMPDLMAIAPTLKLFADHKRIFKASAPKSGGTVWEQGVNTSQTKDGWSDLLTLQKLDNIDSFEYPHKLLAQGFTFTEDEIQHLLHSYNKVIRMKKAGASGERIQSFIDETAQGMYTGSVKRFIRQLYYDAENYLINGSALGWKGFASIVGSSGPSTDFGGLNLSALTSDLELPWYVKVSGGTGAITKYGLTLTGTTMGRAETEHFHSLVVNGQKRRGIVSTHTLVSVNDYTKWQKQFWSSITQQIDIGNASFNKKRDNMANAGKSGAYEIGYDKPIIMNNTIVMESPLIADNSMYVFDINQVGIEVFDYSNLTEFKKLNKIDKDKTTMFAIEAERVATTANGIGRGAVVEMRGQYNFVPTNVAAVTYIGYSAATA